MTPSLKQIFRQPEMPTVIRQQARELTEILEPYEEFMRAVNHANHAEALTANALLREEVLNRDFFHKLDAFVGSIATHLTFVSRSGQSPSRIRQQLRRHTGIICGWMQELHEKGHVLAIVFLEDALHAHDLIYIEHAIPNAALRRETADLILHDVRRRSEIEMIARWLIWRDSAYERTRKMKHAMETFARDVEKYAKDISPLLDTHLVVSEDQRQQSITLDLSTGQQAMLGACKLSITPQKEDNTVDLFGCQLTLHDGQIIEYFVNRTNCEIVPPTLKYVSARYLFARYNLDYVYDALRKVTLLVIYEAITSGRIVPAYWSDEEQIKVELEETEEVEREQPLEDYEQGEPEAQEPQNKPSIEITQEQSDDCKKQIHVARGRVTWSRVLRALKQFGVKVEWNHHPMLVKDGIRVRYANPHDNDARKNARYLHMALRAFKIDRNEFYAILMA